MGMLIIRHKVKDYGKWRPMFDQHSLMQKAAGLGLRHQGHEDGQGFRRFARPQGNDGESWGHGRPDDLFS
jgi:hypothetical protein